MKPLTSKLFFSLFFFTIIIGSCTKDDLDPDTVFTNTIIELDAQAETFIPGSTGPIITGDYTKFSFAEDTVVTGDNWDIAFRSTSILVNGGEPSDVSQPARTGNAAVYIADGTMAEITNVDTSLFLQDTQNGTAIIDDFGAMQAGWCAYDFSTMLISPIPGKILIVRTHDNKYAKVEILNFYDSAMTNQFGGFYTFNYVYQSSGDTSF